MTDIELQNMIIRKLFQHKVTMNPQEASRIAGQLIQHYENRSEDDKTFHSMLLGALTPQEILNIGTAENEAMKKEIAFLKKEIEQLKQGQSQKAQTTIAQSASPKPKEKQEMQYTPDEVAVDKIFYYGKK
ncbi:MAG: hypothetical protein ABIH34_07615 [Nanoarchaeota archaeon]